jgi:hypothetical protein
MVGPDNWQEEAEELRGIIPNAFHHVFHTIDVTKDKQFLVRASYIEIYQEDVRDLLSKDTKRKLELRENADSGVYVKDLTTFVVKDVAECDRVMNIGTKAKTVGATAMNDRSSRSHTIFLITVESSETIDGRDHFCVGKLNLVDLAGSERQSKTHATGDRLKEATKINLSLSALGNVIKALVDAKSQHVPYRDSKLTRLLQDSLGGNTKTVMVANTGPADYNFDETINTLRYANRAKSIKNKPRINEDPKDAMLREYQEEIQKLKAMLAAQNGGIIPEGFPGAGTMMPPGEVAAAGLGGAGGAGGAGGGAGGAGGGQTVIQGVAPELLEELKNKTEEEKREILAEKDMAEAEKTRIMSEMSKQGDRLQRERKQREALARKLKAMQEKLIVGGVNLVDKAAQQEEELRQKEAELAEQRRREEALRAEIEEAEEERMIHREHFDSLQEEVDVKTRQIKKIRAKYESVKNDYNDLQDEFQQEREDLLDSIRDLSKQLRLKMLIIANFIPPEEVVKIERRAEFDHNTDEWRLNKLQLAGNNQVAKRPPSASGARRPTSKYAMMASSMGDDNPRYRGDNVLNLDLDVPASTTADYEAGMVRGYNDDLRSPFEDDNWVLSSNAAHSNNVYFTYAGSDAGDDDPRGASSSSGKPPKGGGGGGGGGGSRSTRPPSGRGGRPPSARKSRKDGGSDDGNGGGGQQEAYPTARGLVSRERRVM